MLFRSAFIERHVSIEDPQGRVIPFTLWPFQRKSVQALHEDGQVIVLKARRLGLSWLFLAYALWVAIFNQGIRVLVLCKNQDDASELLDRIRRMRDRINLDPASQHLLAGLPKPKKVRDAVTTLDVGESTIRALVGKPAAARSETAGLVLLDEFAFQTKASGIWRALIPTIDGGGKVGVISTGDGVTGDAEEFSKQWSRASSGESGFTPLFWPWDARPDRDQDWKARTIELLGSEERFQIEYPEEPDQAFQSPDADRIYSLAGIDAAENLGRLLDGNPPEPAGGSISLGIDWGESTHALTIWPLERGGIYVQAEEVFTSEEPGAAAVRMLRMADATGQPIEDARYDAAGVQSMRTFTAKARQTHPNLRTLSVPFSKYKVESIEYLRRLFNRTAEGKTTQIVAISPTGCPVLLSQLRGLEWKDPDAHKVEKGNDHGPDALLAGLAPIAKRMRRN